MSDIKSLADQLRSKINQPANTVKKRAKPERTADVPPKSNAPPSAIPLLEAIRAYDNSDHKSMVHVRFDDKTVQTMNNFKMATGVDVTKLVAYAVRQLFSDHPELKTIIKQFMQNLE